MKPVIDRRLFLNARRLKADALITVSPKLKAVIRNRFNKDAICIPNVVDTRLFTYAPNNNSSIFRFVSTGNLKPVKRMDLTIEAFTKAFKNDKDVTLTIFGEGPERNKLETIIRNNEIGEKVKLMGLQSRKNISEYLRKSDCFVLASQAETFGVVYIEALASGVPVIATKCGGPESFVNEENGVFVPVDDLESLTNAMKTMHKNINIYNRKAIANKTKELFSPEAIAGKLEKVYENVLLTKGN